MSGDRHAGVLGTLSYVGCSERINAPPLWLAACYQSADAHNPMQRMFGKTRSERLAHLDIGRHTEVEHPRGRGKVRLVSRPGARPPITPFDEVTKPAMLTAAIINTCSRLATHVERGRGRSRCSRDDWPRIVTGL